MKKDTSGLFAKVLLSPIPGNQSTSYITEQEVTFYNKPLEKLSQLSIQFLGGDGKLLPIGIENSITIEIFEIKEVLKETLIDSKRGNIVTTGKYI